MGGQTGGNSGEQRAKSLRRADEEKSGDLHNNSQINISVSIEKEIKRESEEKKGQKTETQGTGGGEVWILCPSP